MKFFDFYEGYEIEVCRAPVTHKSKTPLEKLLPPLKRKNFFAGSLRADKNCALRAHALTHKAGHAVFRIIDEGHAAKL